MSKFKALLVSIAALGTLMPIASIINDCGNGPCSQAAASEIRGGSETCYRQLAPSDCGGTEYFCSDGVECVDYGEGTVIDYDCPRPANVVPLPSPCYYSGLTREFAVINTSIESVAPGSGEGTYEDYGPGAENECQLVYDCSCNEQLLLCFQESGSWCQSGATATNEYVTGNPCEDEY